MSKSVDEKISMTCDCGKTFETYEIILNFARKQNNGQLPELKCFDCREILRKEQEEKHRMIILKQIEERKNKWISACGIQPRYIDKTFENYVIDKQNQLAYFTCVDYAESFPLINNPYHSLGIISDKLWGVGKSHLACSIAKTVIKRWMSDICPVLFVTEPRLFARIRSTYNRQEHSETEQDIIDTLVNIPLLIIDDVGKEEVADPRFVQRVWFQIINGRYDNMLPLVITANMSPDGIAHHLGGSRNNEASFDRLYEMLNGVFYEINGKSHRRVE